MNGIPGIACSMHLAAGSLAAHSVGIQVSAHNVANISTDGFMPQRATYAAGSNGMGVELESVRKLNQSLKVLDAASVSGDAGFADSALPASNTDIAKEMPHMILIERGFQANAAAIRTADEMLGTLLNSIA